jgi:hypothetical protein
MRPINFEYLNLLRISILRILLEFGAGDDYIESEWPGAFSIEEVPPGAILRAKAHFQAVVRLKLRGARVNLVWPFL